MVKKSFVQKILVPIKFVKYIAVKKILFQKTVGAKKLVQKISCSKNIIVHKSENCIKHVGKNKILIKKKLSQ